MFLYFLKVEFKQLNVRLSYNDLKLFLAIAQSLPPLTSSPSAPPTPSGNKVNSKLITGTEYLQLVLLHLSALSTKNLAHLF